MHVSVFSAKSYDRKFLEAANAAGRHRLTFLDSRLSRETAALVGAADGICAFVNDRLDAEVLGLLASQGVRLVTLRCAGFDNVDLGAAARLGISIARVPVYSPAAVAEHTLALILTLNRKIHRAYARVREGNFSLDGLLGFNLEGKTVGVIGTGGIGTAVVRILAGFGCRVLATDPKPSEQAETYGARYVALETLFGSSDIVTLHCPLTPGTRHIINADTLQLAKPGFMLVNAGRGGLIDTMAAIAALKRGRVGSLALDVYERESELFFEDRSGIAVSDDVFARLLTFPNVLITGHQAYFTTEALTAIAETTLANIDAFAEHGRPLYEVNPRRASANVS